MTTERFNVGEQVFELSTGNGIALVALKTNNTSDIYTLEGEYNTYTPKGLAYDSDVLPRIFKATKENYEMLCKFYGEGEVPELAPTGSALSKIILSDHKYINAWVSDGSDDEARTNKLLRVVTFNGVQFETYQGADWQYAVPVDLRNLKEITQYSEV